MSYPSISRKCISFKQKEIKCEDKVQVTHQLLAMTGRWLAGKESRIWKIVPQRYETIVDELCSYPGYCPLSGVLICTIFSRFEYQYILFILFSSSLAIEEFFHY
jgi:hypothetical protein